MWCAPAPGRPVAPGPRSALAQRSSSVIGAAAASADVWVDSPKSHSTVRRSPKWSWRVADTTPARAAGPAKMVRTRLPRLPLSSSHVTISKQLSAVQAGLPRIGGTLLLSHVSPVPTLQLCMSLQTFGVIQAKLGVVAFDARAL